MTAADRDWEVFEAWWEHSGNTFDDDKQFTLGAWQSGIAHARAQAGEPVAYLIIGPNGDRDLSFDDLTPADREAGYSSRPLYNHPSPAQEPVAVPADVVRLVLAARDVAYTSDPTPESIKELDQASEAFAERVPWDDEPLPEEGEEEPAAPVSTPAESGESTDLEEAVRLAEVGEYLFTAKRFTYGNGSTEPREMSISWEWQQSAPEQYGEGMLLAEANKWHDEQAEDGFTTEARKLRAALTSRPTIEDCKTQMDRDIGILLATIDFLAEATGEGPEGEDAAMVSQIKADHEKRLASTPAPQPGGAVCPHCNGTGQRQDKRTGNNYPCPRCETVSPSPSGWDAGAEAKAREALEWYAEQAAGCRKLGSIGDPARQALDRDGGKRAREALSAIPLPTPPAGEG